MEIFLSETIPQENEIWNLFLTTGWNDEYCLSKDEYYRAVKESRFVVTAYYSNTLIGYGRVAADGTVHAMIYDLIVHPDFQNSGAGSKILNRLVELCRRHNIRDIQLFSAKGKKAFYEKRGFKTRPDDAPGMEFKP